MDVQHLSRHMAEGEVAHLMLFLGAGQGEGKGLLHHMIIVNGVCVCVRACVCVYVTHISQIEESTAHLCSPGDVVMAQHDTLWRASSACSEHNSRLAMCIHS